MISCGLPSLCGDDQPVDWPHTQYLPWLNHFLADTHCKTQYLIRFICKRLWIFPHIVSRHNFSVVYHISLSFLPASLCNINIAVLGDGRHPSLVRQLKVAHIFVTEEYGDPYQSRYLPRYRPPHWLFSIEMKNNQFTPRVTGGFACAKAGSQSSSPRRRCPQSQGRVRHLQWTSLVAVPGMGASLRGLQAGRVKRLVAGVRHGFVALSAMGPWQLLLLTSTCWDKKDTYI